MKTITLEVPESVYAEVESMALSTARSSSDVILDALEDYRRTQKRAGITSLRDRRPVSVGGPVQPLTADDDLLDDMLNDPRN